MSQLVLEGTADYHPSYRAQIIQVLGDFRREWQQMVDNQNLVDVHASVGLILSDIADRLELNSQERHAMLGGQLINQINCLMEERFEATLLA
jgi:hypothetical protein